MDQASPSPACPQPGSTGVPEGAQHAADPLAEIIKHCASAWQALRVHAALLVDEGIGRFYGLLSTASMVIAGLSIVVLMMTLGCFYLVSGIALGMTTLVGSVWIGHACAGAIFLIGPALIGYAIVSGRRRAREQRLVSAYRRLQDQAEAS